MANWIRKPGRVTTVSYVRFYEWHGSSGSGFSFDCDKDGVIDEGKLLPCALASLADCRRGVADGGSWVPVPRGTQVPANAKDDPEWHDFGDRNGSLWCTWQATGPRVLVDQGVQECRHSHFDRGAVRCGCGNYHELHDANGMGDSRCDFCDQWRNASGQELEPPCNWGEDTGERFGDDGQYLGGGDE